MQHVHSTVHSRIHSRVHSRVHRAECRIKCRMHRRVQCIVEYSALHSKKKMLSVRSKKNIGNTLHLMQTYFKRAEPRLQLVWLTVSLLPAYLFIYDWKPMCVLIVRWRVSVLTVGIRPRIEYYNCPYCQLLNSKCVRLARYCPYRETLR